MTAPLRDEFHTLMADVTAFVGQRPLDEDLQTALNERYPAAGPEFGRIVEVCTKAIDEGWMCDREGGGIKYGRVFKPAPELADFSVDVVDMCNVVGPHHRHPNGEIDLIMPIDPTAEFDGNGAGWTVYGADSAHPPTVSGGRALVLYLLPQGAIEFSRG